MGWSFQFGMIFITMKLKLSQAVTIAEDFQWMIGTLKFVPPYSGIYVDWIKPKEIELGLYDVRVYVDGTSEGNIGEFFCFKNPECSLVDFARYHKIPFNADHYK